MVKIKEEPSNDKDKKEEDDRQLQQHQLNVTSTLLSPIRSEYVTPNCVSSPVPMDGVVIQGRHSIIKEVTQSNHASSNGTSDYNRNDIQNDNKDNGIVIHNKDTCRPDGIVSSSTIDDINNRNIINKNNHNNNFSDHGGINVNNLHDVDNNNHSDNDNKEDDNEINDDDEEEFYKPPEPNYSRANKLPFRSLCQRFEQVWSLKRRHLTNKGNSSTKNNKKVTKDEILSSLLPKSIITYLKGGSPFPFLRLMVPDLDTLRPHLGVKESTIGKIWAEAIGLGEDSCDYKKLNKFNDPVIVGSSACGDLSMVVYEVVSKRFPHFNAATKSKKDKDKGITIGKINDLLDELAMMKKESMNINNNNTSLHTKGGASSKSKQKMKVRWVEKLISLQLSPLEHKWIVRIILSNLELGVQSDTIIKYYHPWAEDLYAANKNLKTLCSTLCDEEFIKRRKELIELEKNTVDNHNRMNHLPKSNEPAALNRTIAPMLSMRTSFETILVDIQKRHNAYTDLLEKDDPLRSSLSLKHPTFSCEIKMDGERILSHVKRGVVKIQTRNSVWYSKLYSPVLGPSIRRAIEKYDVDVILDGEVVSWDNGRMETIPFGVNRGIAKSRRQYMERNGMLDTRDTNLHDDEEGEGLTVMTESLTYGFDKDVSLDADFESGKDVWLKYVVFDILYLGGPDTSKLIQDAFEPLQCAKLKPTVTGSILNLDLWKRRRILQTLITPQVNMVELIETLIVRPDGQTIAGQNYYSSTDPEDNGYCPMVLDSINCILDGLIPNFQSIDTSKLQRKSLKEMDKARMRALDTFYADVVTSRQLEGLVFKDLCTPYGLGARFRSKGYWFKLKDDYNQGGHANDIDLVVMGGQFATGLRNQGCINKFLCGCVDSDRSDGTKYMTTVYLNGQSTSNANLRKLLTDTGFFTNTNKNQPRDFGKWFKLNHGVIPDFLSQRTFQHSGDAVNSGWKMKKHHYPDLWIDPKDSFVLTINAGEIVCTADFSAGVTLRFPRIRDIRAKDFENGPKPAEEVASVLELHNLFNERQYQQQDAEKELQSQSQYAFEYDGAENKFKSMEQRLQRVTTRKKRPRPELNVRLPNTQQSHTIVNDSLSPYVFMVLDGHYELACDDPLDEMQAKLDGWYDIASKVKSQQDVIDFILMHGGEIGNEDCDFVVGGSIDDARVVNYRRAIERFTKANLSGKTNTDKNLCKMVKSGVVKWTFLYSMVHKYGKEEKPSKLRITLCPRKHDYLVMSKLEEGRLQQIEEYGINCTDDSDLVELKRALKEVQEQRDKRNESLSQKRFKQSDSRKQWQYELDNLFTNVEKSLIIGSRHVFCKLNEDGLGADSSSQSKMQMILYPDINNADDDYDDDIDQDLSEVSSVLPLAKAMGAKVNMSLSHNISHVLCDMHCDSLHWHPFISMNIFYNIRKGLRLHELLVDINSIEPVDITLVSPAWIRKMWR